MTSHYLSNWKQYLTTEDYEYLIQYVENIKYGSVNDNGGVNDKMIILSGPSRTGKSTLKKQIKTYLGYKLCGEYYYPKEIIYDKNIKKLGLFWGIDEIFDKENIRAIINFIKYKQSFITDTSYIQNVNKELLEYSKIITMEHVF